MNQDEFRSKAQEANHEAKLNLDTASEFKRKAREAKLSGANHKDVLQLALQASHAWVLYRYHMSRAWGINYRISFELGGLGDIDPPKRIEGETDSEFYTRVGLYDGHHCDEPEKQMGTSGELGVPQAYALVASL